MRKHSILSLYQNVPFMPMVPNQVHTRNSTLIFFPFLEPGSTETEVTQTVTSHLPVSCCLLLLALALVSASV